ncbi:MAG TPA: DSD1 family PLP-dependent enzyme [Steroidobacteraceae bacterium]
MRDKRWSFAPNLEWIGKPGSRWRLDTPALVLDRDILDSNIAAMAHFARRRGIALRPHAKTHKSAHIAALQLSAGAVGLCCAKLSEAEAFAREGLGPLLITTPVVGTGALQRLAALSARSPGLAVVVDSISHISALAEAPGDNEIDVFIDIDPGQHRTGVAGAEAAVALAREIRRHARLRFAGVQFFSGPTQHIESYELRRKDVELRTGMLVRVIEALRAAGSAPSVVTGGGTGTHEIDAQLGVLTELQVGSYVFMDDQYAACELTAERGSAPFRTALTILTRVISANWPGMVTVDAGYKASTGSSSPPAVLSGAPAGARYEYRGDEHGVIIFEAGDPAPCIGDVIELQTPHCDPTVNLYDAYHVVRGDTLIDIWPVTARGCSL